MDPNQGNRGLPEHRCDRCRWWAQLDGGSAEIVTPRGDRWWAQLDGGSAEIVTPRGDTVIVGQCRARSPSGSNDRVDPWPVTSAHSWCSSWSRIPAKWLPGSDQEPAGNKPAKAKKQLPKEVS